MTSTELCVENIHSSNLFKLIGSIRKTKPHVLLNFLRSQKGKDFLFEATTRDDTSLWLTLLGKIVEGSSKKLSTPEYLSIVQTMLHSSFETGNTQGLKVLVYNCHKSMGDIVGMYGVESLESFLKWEKKSDTSDAFLAEKLVTVLTDPSMRVVFDGYSSRISDMMKLLVKYDMSLFYDVYGRIKKEHPRFLQNPFMGRDIFLHASEQGGFWRFYEFLQQEEHDKMVYGVKHGLTRFIVEEGSKIQPLPHVREAVDEFFQKSELRFMLDIIRQATRKPGRNQVYTNGPLLRYDNLFDYLKKRDVKDFPLIMNFLKQHNSYGDYTDTLKFCENHVLRQAVLDKLEQDTPLTSPKRKM